MAKKFNWHRFWRLTKTYIIFVIAVLAFVILGMFQGDGALSSGGMVAMVNGEVISLADYSQAVQRLEERMGFNTGSMPAQQRDYFTNYLRQQAISNLISVSLLTQGAEKQGIYASDSQVMDYIVNIPAFQENGRFSPEIYNNYLKSTRNKAADFEDDRRREIVINRVQDLFNKTLVPSSIEEEFSKKADKVEADIGYVKFKTADLKVKPSVDQVSAFIVDEGNKPEFENYYNTNKGKFTEEEQVRARHILVKVDSANPESDKLAQAKVKELLVRIKTEPFDKVATAVSEDKGSALKGGDLGFFAKGRMVKEFEDVAFTMQVGQVSEPVKSNFGYHIIKLEEKKPKSVRSLDDVKTEIAKALLEKSLRKDLVSSLGESLKSGKNSTVNSWIKNQGLKWESTGDFKLSTGSVPKLGTEEKVVASALQLKPRQVSPELVKTGIYSYVVKLNKMKSVKAAVKAKDAPPTAQGSQYALNEWVKQMQESSKIKTNQEAIAGK